MKCTVCGTENMADSSVCVKCGSPLPVAEQHSKPEENQNQTEQTPKQNAGSSSNVKPERTSVSKVFIAWFAFNAFGSAYSAFNILKEFDDIGMLALLGAVISIVNCVGCVLLIAQKKMMWFYVYAATIFLNCLFVIFSDGFDMTFALIMVVLVAIELGISYFLIKRNSEFLS